MINKRLFSNHSWAFSNQNRPKLSTLTEIPDRELDAGELESNVGFLDKTFEIESCDGKMQ